MGCGGSIINKNQVITAAHCVEGALPILDSVVAGAHHRILEGGHQTRRVAKMEHHASWNTPPFNNDVALVCPDANGVGKLAGLVSFGYTGCTDAGVYTMVSHYEEWITERLTP